MEQSKLSELIYMGDFKAAYEYATSMSALEIYEQVWEQAHEEKDILFYGFFVHLLLNRHPNELGEIHHSTSALLSAHLCSIPGAYDLAIYHMREAIKMNPEKKNLQTYLKHLLSGPR